MSDFRPEVEIWPFRACAMHPAIIIGTVRSLYIHLLFTRNVSNKKKEIQKEENQKIHKYQKRDYEKPICIVGYFHNILLSVMFIFIC